MSTDWDGLWEQSRHEYEGVEDVPVAVGVRCSRCGIAVEVEWEARRDLDERVLEHDALCPRPEKGPSC